MYSVYLYYMYAYMCMYIGQEGQEDSARGVERVREGQRGPATR